MSRTTTFAGGRTIVVGGAAVSLLMSAGIAAAATGGLSSRSPHGVTETVTTDPVPLDVLDAPVVTEVSDTTLPGGELGDEPQPTVTDPSSEPATTELTSSEPATTDAPVATEPVTTEPVTTEPVTTEPATTEPATTTPTTVFHDTPVPQGIELHCSAEGATVSCSWSVGDIPGFARFLLLRGNGGAQGRVPFQTTDPDARHAIDAPVPAGSYSYVVIALGTNGSTLVHSNPVYLQIDAAN
jgi:hypothetical protein